ncbi:MAG: hypothetical protein PF589_11545 [Gammaproteobacteria bacterium]|jgi:hypothetical protein|nr:hypothetical protein [Gammaproteobacteria bacterium]
MHIKLFEIEHWERETFKNIEKEHQVNYIIQSLDTENASSCNQSEIISNFIYSKPDHNTPALLCALADDKLNAAGRTGGS